MARNLPPDLDFIRSADPRDKAAFAKVLARLNNFLQEKRKPTIRGDERDRAGRNEGHALISKIVHGWLSDFTSRGLPSPPLLNETFGLLLGLSKSRRPRDPLKFMLAAICLPRKDSGESVRSIAREMSKALGKNVDPSNFRSYERQPEFQQAKNFMNAVLERLQKRSGSDQFVVVPLAFEKRGNDLVSNTIKLGRNPSEEGKKNE